MARFLGPTDYGTLAVLFSFIYIFSVPSEALQNITTVYTGKFLVLDKKGKIKALLKKSLKKGFFVSLMLFFIFLPMAYLLSTYLNINWSLLAFTGLVLFFCFSLPIIRGILQGHKKFYNLGVSLLIEGGVKVVFAVALVLLGFGVFGGLTGVLIGLLLAFIAGMFFVKDILKTKEEKEEFKGIYGYSIPYFVSLLAIVLIYSLDVIFAKRFFSAELAGKYAVASMLGKMIFFGTAAIGKAMFPLTSEKHEKGENTGEVVRKSFKILGILTLTILMAFILFPDQLITILFGSEYAQTGILFILGVAFTLLSMSNLLLLYGLCVNRIKKSTYGLLFFVGLEVIAFYMFHSSLMEFAIAFLAVNFLMMIYSLWIVKK